MSGDNAIPELVAAAQAAAASLRASKADVFKHGMELGRNLFELEDHWADQKSGPLSNREINKRRREVDLDPDTLDVPSAKLSNWTKLARNEKALMYYLTCWKGMSDAELETAIDAGHFWDTKNEFVPTVVDPSQLLKDWKRDGRRLRRLAKGRPYRELSFPDMPRDQITRFLGKNELAPEEIHKIQGLVHKAEDREGTPEGDAFREKAADLAEAHGYTVEEFMKLEDKSETATRLARRKRKVARKVGLMLYDDDPGPEIWAHAIADFLVSKDFIGADAADREVTWEEIADLLKKRYGDLPKLTSAG